jgi:hypothetical protein
VDVGTPGLIHPRDVRPGVNLGFMPKSTAVWPIRELFECLHPRCNDVIQAPYLNRVRAKSAGPTRDTAITPSPARCLRRLRILCVRSGVGT